jgi:hypothetical protein
MMDDDSLQRVYQWVDEIPLSRAKRNIARDFADGVLTAEIVHYYLPKLIEVHNYPAANSYAQKVYNWCAWQLSALAPSSVVWSQCDALRWHDTT